MLIFKMRIFIAIGIPESVKEKLRKLQKEFMGDDYRINFVEDFHLTLKFLGDISSTRLDRVKKRLEGVRFKYFELDLTRLGVFPSETYITTLWVGVKPEKMVNEIQSRVDESLKDFFGVDKNFKAHITLGRVKSFKDKDLFLSRLKEIEVKGNFKVKSFKLIKSELGKNGPEYEILEEFK